MPLFFYAKISCKIEPDVEYDEIYGIGTYR